MRGQVERDVTVVDASANGDWSAVKVWYGPIKDIGIKAYLVAGVARCHRPAARLAHIADIKTCPSDLLGELAKVDQVINQHGLAKIAMPGQAHGLPAWAGFGQFDHTRPAAARIASNGHRGLAGWIFLCTKQLVGKIFGTGRWA